MRRALLLAVACSFAACTSSDSQSVRNVQELLPVVLWDASHNNYGVGDSFKLFVQWLEAQGYAVRLSDGSFTPAALDGVDILALDNPLADVNIDHWGLPTPSAYSDEEVSAIVDWVRSGGSLLMVVEHMPFTGAFGKLLRAFGIEASNGFAIRSTGLSLLGTDEQELIGMFVYKRTEGELPDHPVLTGSTAKERIDTLAADWGSAFRMPEGASILLRLPDDALSVEPEVAWEFDAGTPTREVGGWSQAGIMEFGAGRIAVLGDNFMVTHPGALTDPMDDIGAQHPQFTLNLFRWLADARHARPNPVPSTS